MTQLSQCCPKLSKITFSTLNIRNISISPPFKPLMAIKCLSIDFNNYSDDSDNENDLFEIENDFFANLADLTPNLHRTQRPINRKRSFN